MNAVEYDRIRSRLLRDKSIADRTLADWQARHPDRRPTPRIASPVRRLDDLILKLDQTWDKKPPGREWERYNY